MNITLHNSQQMPARNGIAWTCDVHLNGAKVAYASDEGNGGEISIYPCPPYEANNEKLDEMKRWAEALPALVYEGEELPCDLGLWIANQLDQADATVSA